MLIVQALLTLALQGASQPVDFSRDIRPILSDRCFQCHGSGDTSDVGGFRLDVREEAVEDFGGYAPIVPGDPEASEVIVRLRHTKARKRMPPVHTKLEVSEGDIELIERWIADGAVYAEHWSFVAPERSEAPNVELEEWARDDLDLFVLARMESAGFEPSAPAERANWLRRVSFDLCGLPPTLAELDGFIGDEEAGAYERQVDRLLASPRHAERMTTIWLDAARYADTYGYQSDVDRRVWPWRDWVIDSYAKNQSYNEFLTWQIAGDLLPQATREQRLATTFNRLHRQTNEGGSTEEEYRVEYVANRVETLSTAIMGVTMECARCHDHKFDPFSHREFYQLYAFFDDIDESGLYSHFTQSVPTPALDLPTEKQVAELAELEATVKVAEQRLSLAWTSPVISASTINLTRALEGSYSFDQLEGALLTNQTDPEKQGEIKGEPNRVSGYTGTAVEFSGDDPALFPGVGHFQRSDPFSIGLRIWLPKSYERAVVFHRSRAWHDSGSRGYELLIEDGRASAALIHFWPGDAIRVRTAETLPTEEWLHVTVTWDGSSRASGLKLYIDGKAVGMEIVRDSLRRTITGGGIKDFTIGERFRDKGFAGGRADDLFIARRELSEAEVEHMALGEGEPSTDALRRHALSWPPSAVCDALEELQVARLARDKARDAINQIMTMTALPEERQAFLLARGSYLEPSEPVLPQTPASLSPFPEDAPRNRLGLASWLTSPAHPLTARVEVNRLWQLVFGAGLVLTSEDFGSQGIPPSHPDLLDTLAVDFVESGWDRRALIKRMVLSATYRQSSRVGELARESDPDNRWLSHITRRRLTAEMLRDAALFSAGLLVEKYGGPPVKPYQPAGLWKEKSGKVYVPDEGEGLWRRSLYTFWKRTSPPPSMMILDAAKRDVCVVRRQSTSSPLQALLLWNDPQYVEAARELAERALLATSDDSGAIGFIFRSLTSREIAPAELQVLYKLHTEQHAAFAAEPEQASALLAEGKSPLDETIDVTDLAAMAVVAQAVLSFDAAISTP
ncbi:MAG: hypothetical protein ACI8X5_002662 [Planctomycetota bacterium]|jgi:hypothetical protein